MTPLTITRTTSTLASSLVLRQHFSRPVLVTTITNNNNNNNTNTTTTRSLSDATNATNATDGPKQRLSKVKKKKGKGGSDTKTTGNSGGRSRDLELILACLDAPKQTSPPPPTSNEEVQRRNDIFKRYTVGKFQQHNVHNHDISCKLKLKRHAMNVLPRNSTIFNKANTIDEHTMPPKWRNIPAYTPPIPGFDPSEFMIQEE